ncbi:MAG: hypothetical protein JRJ02_06975, partial [Deltaproteobacteria bacterium]|nr:hypothetical protein [Deltaproteobacteria bacterium]
SNVSETIDENNTEKATKALHDVNWWIGIFFVIIAVLVVYLSGELSLRGKLFPWVVGIPIILIGLVHTFQGLFSSHKGRSSGIEKDKVTGLFGGDIGKVFRAFRWVTLLLVSVILIGHKIAVPLFVITYLLAHKEKLWFGITMAASSGIFIYFVLGKIMSITFSEPILFRWLGF